MKKTVSALSFLATSLTCFVAAAQEKAGALSEVPATGIAVPWQMNFQDAATPVMERLYTMNNSLNILITAISLFVLVVMTYICIRFRRKANPIPSKTTHNVLLEIVWTTIPILILITIAIPSLRLHYYMQKAVEPEMTLKVVGHQWYWHYDYPDQGGFGFDSYMKKGADLKEGDHRMLAVDNPVVVPVDTTVRVLLTGADVIHAWAVPAFGVKRDAVPGRLNESWFKATRIGTYYGQCSELCGVGHGFMPITVQVVSKEDFRAWTAKKREESGIPAAAQAADGKPAPKAESAASGKPSAPPARKQRAVKAESARSASADKDDE